jgi:hypothetical protein
MLKKTAKQTTTSIVFLYLHYIISLKVYGWLVWFIVFNATFDNSSVLSWKSVSLVGGTGVPGENHRPIASH